MKSKSKNKGKRNAPQQKKRNMKVVTPEVLFAQKLAANDPILRNRAVKKLQKWLKLRSDQLSQDEILRIWKGLHYCFWMSDKPLIQEELAETIGHLIHCFNAGSDQGLMFAEAGLITEGREWVGIDQWRMDKFMMLLRRLLRQIFAFLAKDKWSKVKEISGIFSSRVISNSSTTLGFRLHFTDIFLEELAKIAGENIESKIILEFIEPFAKELAEGSDERLAKHIIERIFQYLMRQSDIGIATEEVLVNNGTVEESDEEEDNDEEDEEMPDLSDVKDPRAGNVSVSLPQLKPDFGQLAETLFQFGSVKKICSRRRSQLYDLTKQFKDLAQDVYPLIPDLSAEEDKIPKIKVTKEARRQAKEDLEYQERIAKERDDFKKSLKRKNGPVDDLELEADEAESDEVEEPELPPKKKKAKNSEPLSDEDSKKKKKTSKTESPQKDTNLKKKKKKKSSESDENATQSETNPSTEKPKKKKKKKVAEEDTTEVFVAKMAEEVNGESAKKKKKKKQKVKDQTESIEESEPLTIVKSSEKKKKKKKGAESGDQLFAKDDDWNPTDASIKATTPTLKNGQKGAVFLKKSKSVESKRIPGHISLLEEKKRRISFALSQNKCESLNDIDKSMQDSPDIPFLPEKVPKQGVLKSKSVNSTPNVPLSKAALSYNTMMNGKSKAAKKLGLNSSRLLFNF